MDAELGVHTDNRSTKTDFLVESAPDTIEPSNQALRNLLIGPFDTQIGQCAILQDPCSNSIVILDDSKGLF